VLDENPEVTKELTEFFKEVLFASIENNSKIPASFREALETTGVSVEMVEGYLTATPRLICDFMDTKEVIIAILNHKDIGWTYEINGSPCNIGFYDRKEAEIDSVVESISYYKEISNQKDDKKSKKL
jgi:hypothetical protein